MYSRSYFFDASIAAKMSPLCESSSIKCPPSSPFNQMNSSSDPSYNDRVKSFTYSPNLNDPRVRARVQKVIDLVLPLLTLDEPTQLDAVVLTRVFGNQTSNPLSRWLRDAVLDCVGFFDVDDAALSYVINKNGVELLLRALDSTSRTSK